MNNRLLLNFIFRNEEKNLPRMLRSVKPYICGCVAVDTGDPASTDASVRVILEELAGLPVEIHNDPFVNFSQARNSALRRARASDIPHDYLLLADCDMELIVRRPLPKLTEPAYAIMQDNGQVTYWNVRLLRRDTTQEYRGVTHECIAFDPPPFAIDISTAYYKDHETGSNRTEKYVRDIKLLTESLKNDPTNMRDTFYLIQSLHGAGMIERAYEMSTIFVTMGEGMLSEEKFWALLERAMYATTLNKPMETVIEHYMAAWNLRPHRAEPLVALATYLRLGDHLPHFAHMVAREAAMLPRPQNEVLPVDTNTYEWRALDEWMVTSANIENFHEARHAAKRLQKRRIPADHRERVMANINALPNKRRA